MLSTTFAALRSIDGLTLRVGWTDPAVARIDTVPIPMRRAVRPGSDTVTA